MTTADRADRAADRPADRAANRAADDGRADLAGGPRDDGGGRRAEDDRRAADRTGAGDGDRAMGERAAGTGTSPRRMAGSDGDPRGDDGTTLIETGRAREYQDRWRSVKGDFVDEPRRAVRDANALVGEVLDDLETLFRRQRERLERDLDDADASTEDLRLAMNRYRSFFDRLLSL